MSNQKKPPAEPRLAMLGNVPPPPDPGSRRLVKPALVLMIAIAAVWLVFRPESNKLDVYLHIADLQISDPALDSCIRETGAKRGWLDVGQFTSLRCNHPSGGGIERLDGLEHFVVLTDLNLAFNRIGDAAPLADLPHLESLELSHNDLQALPVFSSASDLVRVELNYNRLTSLEWLNIQGFGSLQVLSASHNRISDIQPLIRLPALRELSLRSNEIHDLDSIYSLDRLDLLDVGDNFVESVSDIGRLQSLRRLFLDRNRISSLDGLQSLPNLERLDVGYNRLDSVGELAEQSRLQRLSLRHTDISDLSGVLALGDLEFLDISDNPDLDCRAILSAVEEYSSESVVFDQGCGAVPATRPE